MTWCCRIPLLLVRHTVRLSIGGHYQYHVSEIRMIPLIVGETCVVHHLQEDVVDVGMRLLYLVEEKDAVGGFAYGISELSSILISHITCLSEPMRTLPRRVSLQIRSCQNVSGSMPNSWASTRATSVFPTLGRSDKQQGRQGASNPLSALPSTSVLPP